MMDGTRRLAIPVDEDDHIRGEPDAPVTLVEYGDFECPYCGQAYPVVKALEREFADSLRFVFRNFPLPQHPHAYPAAESTEFSADSGRFWEMHDVLYEHQLALDLPHLLTYARELGLDSQALLTALRTGTYRPLIEDVRAGGIASGVEGTPTFFINDTLFVGEPSFEGLSEAIVWQRAQSVTR